MGTRNGNIEPMAIGNRKGNGEREHELGTGKGNGNREWKREMGTRTRNCE